MTDKDVIKGKIEQGHGLIKEASADVNDDLYEKVAGKAQQAAGKIQEEFGHAKDKLKEEVNKL